MKLFKKSVKQIDERIENIQNKIYKEAYVLVVLICIVSAGVKYYMYGSNISHFVTEYVILIGTGIYYWIRTARLGIYKDMVEIHDRSSKIPMSSKNIIIGLVSGVIISVFFGVRSAVLFGNASNRLWYFILVFFVCFMIYCPFFVALILLTDTASRKAAKKTVDEDKE